MPAGHTTVLPFTIWMPKLDTRHAVAVSSPTHREVVITTPYMPGLELHLPPETTLLGEDGKPVTEVSLTPIPVDRPPFPLAKNVDVLAVFHRATWWHLHSDGGPCASLAHGSCTRTISGRRLVSWRSSSTTTPTSGIGMCTGSAGLVPMADRAFPIPRRGSMR